MRGNFQTGDGHSDPFTVGLPDHHRVWHMWDYVGVGHLVYGIRKRHGPTYKSLTVPRLFHHG